jgi:hypothetical protein
VRSKKEVAFGVDVVAIEDAVRLIEISSAEWRESGLADRWRNGYVRDAIVKVHVPADADTSEISRFLAAMAEGGARKVQSFPDPKPKAVASQEVPSAAGMRVRDARAVVMDVISSLRHPYMGEVVVEVEIAMAMEGL